MTGVDNRWTACLLCRSHCSSCPGVGADSNPDVTVRLVFSRHSIHIATPLHLPSLHTHTHRHTHQLSWQCVLLFSTKFLVLQDPQGPIYKSLYSDHKSSDPKSLSLDLKSLSSSLKSLSLDLKSLDYKSLTSSLKSLSLDLKSLDCKSLSSSLKSLSLDLKSLDYKSLTSSLKDHRQRIRRFVTRRYLLEKSIQKKLFCHLQSTQIKTIFQEKKTIINSISENLLSRFIYGRDVIGANW